MIRESIRGHLDLLLLGALAEGPAHGYLLIERLRERSDGHFDFPEGTIYPALHRLEAAGVVASTWSSETGRRRRVYRLTKKGRAALRRERAEWRLLARAIARVLGNPA